MVFNTALLWILGLILSIWLTGVTFLLLRALANYNRLTKGVSEKTLSEILGSFLEQDKVTKKELERVIVEIAKVHKASHAYLQKVGFVRFNPFSDTGGDQSFALVLLDGDDNGIIMTSLFARTGVRWYVKTIRRGKGVEHELSKEEKQAVKQALHQRGK